MRLGRIDQSIVGLRVETKDLKTMIQCFQAGEVSFAFKQECRRTL